MNHKTLHSREQNVLTFLNRICFNNFLEQSLTEKKTLLQKQKSWYSFIIVWKVQPPWMRTRKEMKKKPGKVFFFMALLETRRRSSVSSRLVSACVCSEKLYCSHRWEFCSVGQAAQTLKDVSWYKLNWMLLAGWAEQVNWLRAGEASRWARTQVKHFCPAVPLLYYPTISCPRCLFIVLLQHHLFFFSFLFAQAALGSFEHHPWDQKKKKLAGISWIGSLFFFFFKSVP